MYQTLIKKKKGGSIYTYINVWGLMLKNLKFWTLEGKGIQLAQDKAQIHMK